ncbi:MAG: radical SAM protein [Raineya sp.]|nr:radical SAM protein [Raineya sp.]MDW8297032.1 radical SAM protein [Raineya sp.]
MKLSRYNSLIAYKGKYLLFNAFTKKVIFIEPLLKELLESAAHYGVSELAEVHPQFYEYLCKHNFIIADEIDELALLKEKVYRIDNNNTQFELTINPTMNCNFKCWYCYETHIKTSRLNQEGIQKIQKFIQRTLEEMPSLTNFTISFFGGEPLLYFEQEVTPIIRYAYQITQAKNVQLNLHFTTNGYLINEKLIEFFKELNLFPTFQITLDGNETEHDKVRYINKQKGTYRKITENIKSLAQAGFNVIVRINYTEKNLISVKEIPADFADVLNDEFRKNLHFSLHRVWQDKKPSQLVDNELPKVLERIRTEGFVAMEQGAIDSVENSCYADKRYSAVINYNGDVYKCTARDFTPENRVGYLTATGEIFWENNHLEQRMNVKFHNPPCLSCRIQPLCNGGCSQQAIENWGMDYCVHQGDEREKDKVVLQHVEQILLSKNLVLATS